MIRYECLPTWSEPAFVCVGALIVGWLIEINAQIVRGVVTTQVVTFVLRSTLISLMHAAWTCESHTWWRAPGHLDGLETYAWWKCVHASLSTHAPLFYIHEPMKWLKSNCKLYSGCFDWKLMHACCSSIQSAPGIGVQNLWAGGPTCTGSAPRFCWYELQYSDHFHGHQACQKLNVNQCMHVAIQGLNT